MVQHQLIEHPNDRETIENFLYENPDQSRKGAPGIIASKAEFKRGILHANELPPRSRGTFFAHQRIRHKILNFMDRAVITDEPGSGKTCSVTGFAEYIANLDKTHFKRCFIITARGIKNEIMSQIVCKCSEPGKYDTDVINAMKNEEAQRAQITRKLNQWYTICTYDSFIKEVLKALGYDSRGDKKSDLFYRRKIDANIRRKMAEYLSDTIIWIDELHNMRVKPGKRDIGKEKNYRYEVLHDVFHMMERSKLIGTSATLAINFPKEMGPLFNLFTPLTRQIPDDFDWLHTSPKELEKYIRNLVLYVRGIENDIDIVEAGEYTISKCEKTTYPLKLYVSQMSDFQSRSYQASRASHKGTGEEERNASLFVFPDGKWGTGTTKTEKETARLVRQANKQKKAERLGTNTKKSKRSSTHTNMLETEDESFRRYIKQIKTNSDIYEPTNEFRKAITSLEDVKEYSAIFYDIIRIETSNTGCGYVFLNYVDGGAVPLAMCLELLGWERFYERESIFTSATKGGAKPFCREQLDDERVLKKIFKTPKLRYAMLIGATPDNRAKIMFEAWNSYENRHGDIIKLFIVSPTGKEGLSLNHVLRIHHDPTWSWSEIIQAIARALRITSHNMLLEEKENILVTIYRHIAMDNEGESTGCYMYHRALNKNLAIANVMRMIHIISLDCNLTRARNILPGDKPGTEDCDYQNICDYECMYQTPDFTDYSSADNLYVDEVYDELVPFVKELYLEANSYTYDELVYQLNKNKEGYIPRELDLTLSHIINDYIVIHDRLGYECFLKEQNKIFFLVHGFSSFDMDYQSSNFYDKTVLGLVYNDDLDTIIEHMKQNVTFDLNDIDVDTLFNEDLDKQIAIFEAAYIASLNRELPKKSIERKILKYYRDLYKVDSDSERTLRGAKGSEPSEGNVLHWIGIRQKKATGHGRIQRMRKLDFPLRLFVEDKWQSIRKAKNGFEVYEPKDEKWVPLIGRYEVINQVEEHLKDILTKPIAAYILSDGTILVTDVSDEQNKIEGRAYLSTKLPTIYNILYGVGADLPTKKMQELHDQDIKVIEKYLDKRAPKSVTETLNSLNRADPNGAEGRNRFFYAFLASGKQYTTRTGKLMEYFLDTLGEKELLVYL